MKPGDRVRSTKHVPVRGGLAVEVGDVGTVEEVPEGPLVVVSFHRIRERIYFDVDHLQSPENPE